MFEILKSWFHPDAVESLRGLFTLQSDRLAVLEERVKVLEGGHETSGAAALPSTSPVRFPDTIAFPEAPAP